MEGDDSEVRQIMAQFDAPAFVRRARRVEAVWEGLIDRCRLQRDEWLKLPKVRLAVLVARAGGWTGVGRWIADPADVRELQQLFEDWQPRLRVRIMPSASERRLRNDLRELCTAFSRFNERWRRFLSEVSLAAVNHERAAYNRFYVLEQECSLRSAAVARQGFRPLPPARTDDLLALFPLLRVPRSTTAEA